MKSLAAPLVFFFLLGIGVTFAQNPKATTLPGAFVDVDGGRVYYQECGTGPDAVVLLHDGVVNSAVWDEVWPAFCKRFHTIRYDRRGYGRSPETKSPYYEADDLAALLNSRKIAHAALVASSHRGQVALEFALRYPAYVSHLVVVGPSATGFPPSEYFLMRERANSQSDKVEDLTEASVRDPSLSFPATMLPVNGSANFLQQLRRTSRTTICRCQNSPSFRTCRNCESRH